MLFSATYQVHVGAGRCDPFFNQTNNEAQLIGKQSSILDAFLNRPFDSTYHPTIKPRTAVNSVELQGGKQCYLIVGSNIQANHNFTSLTSAFQIEELGELESAILENEAKLNSCDVVCYTYDSSDPDSFAHIVDLRVWTTCLYLVTHANSYARLGTRNSTSFRRYMQP